MMGMACSMHRRKREMYAHFSWEEFMDRRHMQVLGAERKMPFKTSLELSLLKMLNIRLPSHAFYTSLPSRSP